MEARANEAEIKQEFCLVVEDSLDAYYHQIFMMLRNLEKKGKGSLSYKYEVDFLCKNEDPESPGVRELASYTRFDYIEKVRYRWHGTFYADSNAIPHSKLSLSSVTKPTKHHVWLLWRKQLKRNEQ